MLHDLCDTMQKSKQLEADARDQLFRLGQKNPDVLVKIGELLSRSNALQDEVANGLLLTILRLGVASKLQGVAAALNFQGFFQDVETLFAPAGTND